MSDLTVKAIRSEFIALLAEKPIDHVTVKDIASRCGINRNTFYYHYHDIFHLLDDILAIEAQRINDMLTDEHLSWTDAFLEASDFIWRNKEAALNIYHSVNRDRLQSHAWEIASKLVAAVLENRTRNLSPDPQKLQETTTIYTATLVGLAEHWLRTGMKDDPRQILPIFEIIAEGGAITLFEGNPPLSV